MILYGIAAESWPSVLFNRYLQRAPKWPFYYRKFSSHWSGVPSCSSFWDYLFSVTFRTMSVIHVFKILRFLDKIEWIERIDNAIILRKEKDTWLWIYGLKATGSLSKAVLKNDPLWWNGISRVSRCYLSLPTQYQFVIPQTAGDIKAELRPSFWRDFYINIEKNKPLTAIWFGWQVKLAKW